MSFYQYVIWIFICLRNKSIPMVAYVLSEHIDVLALTETWLDTDEITMNELISVGY